MSAGSLPYSVSPPGTTAALVHWASPRGAKVQGFDEESWDEGSMVRRNSKQTPSSPFPLPFRVLCLPLSSNHEAIYIFSFGAGGAPGYLSGWGRAYNALTLPWLEHRVLPLVTGAEQKSLVS